MKFKKGLSPVIASVLLMVLAIAGAMVVYRFFLTATNTITSNFAYQVVDEKITTLSSGNAAFYMAIKNVGSLEFQVESVEVSKDGGNWTTITSSAIGKSVRPGNTITIDGIIRGLSISPGDDCIVKVTVKLGNGDTKIIQEVVRAE